MYPLGDVIVLYSAKAVAFFRTKSPAAIYTPQNGEVVAPDGTRFTVSNPTNLGDDGWRQMLGPAS